MKTGIYNIEACIGANGKPYIMEVSPRGGGCRIAEIQNMAYGEYADLIENEIRKAVGDEKNELKACCLNVFHSVDIIESSMAIRVEEEHGLMVAGAVYRLGSGKVEFLDREEIS